jgi:hypothetical protein
LLLGRRQRVELIGDALGGETRQIAFQRLHAGAMSLRFFGSKIDFILVCRNADQRRQHHRPG